MEREDFEFEEFMISESVGLSFHGFDLVIGPFEWSGRDRVVVPSEDSLGMPAERSRSEEHTSELQSH